MLERPSTSMLYEGEQRARGATESQLLYDVKYAGRWPYPWGLANGQPASSTSWMGSRSSKSCMSV
jgi:hypothetical protein